MQSFGWPPEHSAAPREHVTRGMSYAEAVEAINARFGTAYTPLAAISRGKRMKLAAPPRPEKGPSFVPRSQKPPRAKSGKKRSGVSRGSAANPVPPAVERAKPPVGISPRRVSLLDLGQVSAAIPMAATGTERPSPSAVIPAFAARSTARRIFT